MLSFSIYSLIIYGILGAIIYHYIPQKYRGIFLSVFSILVCTVWMRGAVTCLIFAISVGIACSKLMDRCINPGRRKWILGAGISILIFNLLCHKLLYSYFVGNKTYEGNSFVTFVMPLGLSYYSFKIISYLIDRYIGKITNATFWEFVSYVSLFTQIASGPISRYEEVDVNSSIDVEPKLVYEAVYRLTKGLFYKLVIADRLSTYTITVMNDYNSYSSMALWMAMLLFSIELYADFAGYSEIAIGLCCLFGFNVKENFRNPYFSSSFREFWNRWHISLSTWLRDYVYIPLGGNRKGNLRKAVNVFIVFLVSGIWHGHNICYILWGIWHGILNILSPKAIKRKCNIRIGRIVTFLLVSLGWLCFRLESVADICSYLDGMINRWSLSLGDIVSSIMPFSGDMSCVAKVLTIGLFILFTTILEWNEYRGHTINKDLRLGFYIISVILFGCMGMTGFIYANY